MVLNNFISVRCLPDGAGRCTFRVFSFSCSSLPPYTHTHHQRLSAFIHMLRKRGGKKRVKEELMSAAELRHHISCVWSRKRLILFMVLGPDVSLIAHTSKCWRCSRCRGQEGSYFTPFRRRYPLTSENIPTYFFPAVRLAENFTTSWCRLWVQAHPVTWRLSQLDE